MFQTEQLKRTNNMWTNDSLFLREYILIPLNKSPLQESKPFANGILPSGTAAHTPQTDEEIVTKRDLRDASKMSRSASSRSVASEPGYISKPAEPSTKDFLSKFDCTLAQIKSNVQRLETSSK